MKTETMFPKLTDYQMECAVEAGEVLSLSDGDTIFREGQGRADFFVVLDGRIKVTRQSNGDESVLVVHEPGEFTGTTDLLTGELATATGVAIGPTRVARVPVEKFSELILACPEMRALLLPALTERRNTEYAIESQQQKLAALGKMSAGLAHELNNPAAAARRSAQTLVCALTEVESLCCELLNQLIARDPAGHGVSLKSLCDLAERGPVELDAMTRSDREDEMSSWLESLGVAKAWELSGSLVSAGIAKADLAPIASRVSDPLAAKLIAWLARDIEMRLTCHDLDVSTGRMTEIVSAMKEYSHMDRGPAKAPTDLHKGLDTTLTLLKHRMKTKKINLQREYGTLPPVPAFGGELNQVWTNLLNNAIDAAPTDGHITIRTNREADHARIEIADDGPGIPPEVQPRIFEPFFTTKGVGEGTGLGLDITYRIIKSHGGDIRFESRPGSTRFMVWLPLK